MMAVGRARALCILPVLLSALAQAQPDQQQVDCYSSVDGTVHNYGALTIDDSQFVPFRQYAGKFLLIVNVATF